MAYFAHIQAGSWLVWVLIMIIPVKQRYRSWD